MAENQDASTQEPHDDDEALKKRLLSRIAIAGVVIVALLGGLAVVDAVFGPPQKTAKEDAVATAEPEEKKAEAKPEDKAETPPAEKPAEVAQAETKEPPKPEVPAKPEVAAEPERTTAAVTPAPRPARPLTLPATPRSAAIRPAAPAAAPLDAQKEIARTAPPSPLAHHAPASRPLSQAVENIRQYVLQMGVFNNVANAEELRAKLELAGVPSQIEARVQVGPFRTRQEADAMREKLRALGMETGILTALKK